MKKEMQNYTQNRELSWLKFNQRVLEEAKDSSVPLLERMKFVSIFTSNLDEFFMIRVGSLYDMSLTDNSTIDSRSGMNPKEHGIPGERYGLKEMGETGGSRRCNSYFYVERSRYSETGAGRRKRKTGQCEASAGCV